MRALLAAAALCLITEPALAASPKVEAAAEVFKAVAADAGKLKSFCELVELMDKQNNEEDKALQARIEGYFKQLGDDFATAWDAGGDLDEDSADGKAYGAAFDALVENCP
jgi:hypothetical protein